MIIVLRKRIAFVLTLLLVLLVGCDTDYEASQNNYRSNLDTGNLNIALVGDKGIKNIEGVNFVETNLQSLIQEKHTTYDGILIYRNSFQEAIKMEYKDFFRETEVPIFFIDAEDILVASFREKVYSLEEAKISWSGAYAAGFLSTEDGYKEWSLHLPNQPTKVDKEEKIIMRIIDIINKNKQ
ncbi:hypothetical protein [Paenibacillus massiliensis]|uniref:hypothetical protein n=1 Tax=Paenibacillus massiliensis TaxID=225917 RepID=UPI00048F6F19|nr:hypothetical protein [Paenibacillus massiliensis]